MHYILGIDPGYSQQSPTTGFAVLAANESGDVVSVAERAHCKATELLESELPRLVKKYAPRIAAIDAPLMDSVTEVSPFGTTKCRPQELVSMQTAFASCRLKAGHTFTPRGLGLHRAGQAVADKLRAYGFRFDPFKRIPEFCAVARAGGSPVVVEAFPKLWLGLQLPPSDLTSDRFTRVSHDRDAAMLLALLDDPTFRGRFAIDGCARSMRMILNGDELAAVTSALSGAAALYGARRASGAPGPAVVMGSPRGGHFILPPRLAWHADHAIALEAAVLDADARRNFDGCALLELG